MKYILTALIFILVETSILFAQCSSVDLYKDNLKVIGAMAQLSDNKLNNHFEEAVPYLNFLLKNTPKVHTSVYVQGAEILRELAREEEDATRKRIYIDSLMVLYDLRISNCGQEAVVLNRKALDAYFFDLNTPGKEEFLLDLFDNVFELNGNDVMDGTLVPYMQVIQINKVRLKKLSDDEIMKRYELVVGIIDSKLADKPENKLRYEGYRDQTDKILMATLEHLDCSFIKESMAPQFYKSPTDASLVKRMFVLMTHAKCTDDSLWVQVGLEYVKAMPDFKVMMILARKLQLQDRVKDSETILYEALEKAKTPEEKSESYILLASLDRENGNRQHARQQLWKALEADPKNKLAYEIMGDLYSNSFKECSEGNYQAVDRLVYLAAYNMYQKAGAVDKMEKTKAAFPSAADYHLLDWKVGDTKTVGCWIQTEVVLQKRD